MKVVHLVAFYQEGLGYEENNLGFAQAMHGAKVTLITSTRPLLRWSTRRNGSMMTAARGQAVPMEKGRYEDRGVTIVRLPALLEVRGHAQILLRNLAAAIREESPDILHIHDAAGALTVQGLRIAKRLSLRTVVDSHMCYFNLRPYNWKKRLYYSLFRRFVRPYFRGTISRYMPLMPDSAALLTNELGVSPREMTHTTLGADTSRFTHDSHSRHRIRKELGIPESAQVATFAGRITLGKDVDVLIRASLPILDEHDLHLLIIGPIEDKFRNELSRMVPVPQRQRLHLVGQVAHEQLPAYFSSGDLGVWPGDAAITIIEAMATGLPLVLSRSESTRHLVSAGNGLVFTRGDVGDLSSQLVRMLADREGLVRMGRASRRLAEEVFDWSKVANRALQIYDEVLTGKSHGLPPLWS